MCQASNLQPMKVTELTPLFIALLGAAGTGAVGSWLLIRHKLRADKSQLTKDEFVNVSEMIDGFIVSLQDKADRIKQLYATINELQQKLLAAESELQKLKSKHDDKRDDIVN